MSDGTENGTQVIKGTNLTMERAEALDQVMATLSSLRTRRKNFATTAGLQFGGARDIGQVAGYVPVGSEKFDHYWGLYQRGDIAARIVDLPAKTTWKTAPDIQEPDQEEETEFVASFNEMAKRLQLWERLTRTDILSRLGRYGILLIGARGTDSSLATELPRMQGPDDVLYLSSFHEGSCSVSEWVTDPRDPRFGSPLLYEVDLSSGVENFPSTKATVHHSRVIHVAEGLLEDDVYGTPALKRVLNRLYDLEKVAASTGEAFWQMAVRILQGKLDPDLEIDEDDLKKLGEDMEEIVHDLRRHFLGQGVDLSWLSGDMPDPTGPGQFYMSLTAASSGIPKRILFGTETGERASEQDQRSWLGSVEERREQHAEPNLLRALVDRLIQYGGLPEPKTGGYDVSWYPLAEQTGQEIAEENKTRAETAKILAGVVGDALELVTVDDDGNVWLKSTKVLGKEGLFTPDADEEATGPPPPIPPEADPDASSLPLAPDGEPLEAGEGGA